MTGIDVAASVQAEQASSASDIEVPRVFPPKTLASAKDRQRQSKIGPIGFSHIAIQSRDVKATRRFYEEVIGLPLVLCVGGKDVIHPSNPEPIEMIHFFFELADGTAIGFFGLEEGKAEPPLVLPNHNLKFHFAVQMDSAEAVHEARARIEAAGYKCAVRDHDNVLSLYIDDPDGVQLELCYHRATWFANIDVTEAGSRLDQWIENGGHWS